jgi:hypothetical protein
MELGREVVAPANGAEGGINLSVRAKRRQSVSYGALFALKEQATSGCRSVCVWVGLTLEVDDCYWRRRTRRFRPRETDAWRRTRSGRGRRT